MQTTINAQNNETEVNLNRFCGKWFVIASIPTRFDKSWDYVTESYSLASDNKIAVFTTYVKPGSQKVHSVKSKGFPAKNSGNRHWKVQFVWPFKADYLIEILADDYSYTVGGHPKKKFLYIMNRSGQMDDELYERLLAQCNKNGYDLKKLRKIKQ